MLDIIFITRNLEGNFNNLIDRKKFKLALIKNNKLKNDLNETKKICKKFKINFLIVDSYKIGINWEKEIRSSVEKLIVIEEFSVVNKYKPIKHIPTANHIDQCIIFLKNIFKIIGTIGTYNAVIKAALETSLFNKAIC